MSACGLRRLTWAETFFFLLFNQFLHVKGAVHFVSQNGDGLACTYLHLNLY